jgi:hypothetical protein
VASDNSSDDKLREELPAGGVGDVETAGETTAAATIGGNENEKPVGADTLVKIQGETNTEENESK